MSSRMAKQATANSDAVAAELRALDASLDFLDEGVAESFGIKRSDLRAIEVVSRRGRLTAGQLAGGVCVAPRANTRLLDRLEGGGYLLPGEEPRRRGPGGGPPAPPPPGR